MPDPDERPRGILTAADRALLRGEKEYDHQQQYSNRRQNIRERITNGILDFNTIQYLLSNRDRKRIFQDPAREAGTENAYFYESVRAMLYWTYFGLKEQNYDFEGLLIEAIEEAEDDFAREYWGDSVDVSVQFNVDVTRSHDLDDLISAIERGGPIKANRLYELLSIPGGVPIDTSKLDTLRVWFQSSYVEGEKEVVKAIFSEYLGVDIEIKDTVARISPEDLGIEKENAVVDKDRSRPRPNEIKNFRISRGPEVNLDAVREEARRQRILSDSTDECPSTSDGDDQPPEEEKSIVEAAIDDHIKGAESPSPSIKDIIDNRKSAEEEDRDGELTPEKVLDLLKRVRDPFVSTVEIAAALGSAREAARHSLSTLANSKRVKRHSIIGCDGQEVVVWWLVEQS